MVFYHYQAWTASIVIIIFISFRLSGCQVTTRTYSTVFSTTAFVASSTVHRRGGRQKTTDSKKQRLGFFFGSPREDKRADNDDENIDSEGVMVGRVIRLAARSYHPQHSKPSSREYTTRKVEQQSVQVQRTGVSNDYNHYRTIALQNTTDRAVSILTTDCQEYLKAYQYPVRDGDLGENILVDGLKYGYFQIGKRYAFGGKGSSDENAADVVLLEITEPIIACANLCKLPYINNAPEKTTPAERIKKCKEFLALLDKQPGLRGWYAKVIQEGRLECGATVVQRANKA